MKVKTAIETIFADSKVASCENLIAIFAPRYQADPENLALVSNIVKLMNTAEDCASNDLYLNAVTSMYKLDPSYRSAFGLYRLNAARGNVADAARYLEEAILSPDSDAATDAQYYYEMAAFCYKNGMRGKASEAARKAVELDYGYAGKAYLILATSGHRPPAPLLRTSGPATGSPQTTTRKPATRILAWPMKPLLPWAA
jgi:tetratricopeptide (TPR) repeat protein